MERSQTDNPAQKGGQERYKQLPPNQSPIPRVHVTYKSPPKENGENLDVNQTREQAGFRKGFARTGDLHTINQVIEKSNEFSLPLWITFVSDENEVMFKTIRNIGINESYINIIEDI